MTVTFDDQAGMTKLTIRMVFDTALECDQCARKYGAVEGAKQTLGRLAEFLKKMINSAH